MGKRRDLGVSGGQKAQSTPTRRVTDLLVGPAPQVACMQFINIVVHSVENMNFRVFLQYEFTHLGLDLYLEVSPASPCWDLTTRRLQSVALCLAAWVLRSGRSGSNPDSATSKPM